MLLRHVIGALALSATLALVSAGASTAGPSPQLVVRDWNRMVLSLTRHTPTYTPPVASRTFAYLGIAAYEAVAGGSDKLQSLTGQLNGLTTSPSREAGAHYDEAVVLEATLSTVIQALFDNTGPTGQRAFQALETKLRADTESGVAEDVLTRSEAYGTAVAAHILDWAKGDGGASIVNMGFPRDYKLIPGPAHWVPTSTIVQQQAPLLPEWGKNRTFAMPAGSTCPVPAAVPYSDDPASEFYKQAKEVYDTKNNLTAEQKAIARFWSDDPMLSWTPPGHWISIALQILERDDVGLEKTVDTLARLSIAEADAFIGCWDAKFTYDLVRPVTYIRRVIDTKWETLINTPPFPEYPSGHSTASAAAALVLTGIFGDSFAFDDTTGARDGLAARHHVSFWAAANEAGISRLYGGIHFRAAIENGLTQGRCIGAYALALKTWR